MSKERVWKKVSAIFMKWNTWQVYSWNAYSVILYCHIKLYSVVLYKPIRKRTQNGNIQGLIITLCGSAKNCRLSDGSWAWLKEKGLRLKTAMPNSIVEKTPNRRLSLPVDFSLHDNNVGVNDSSHMPPIWIISDILIISAWRIQGEFWWES